MMVGYGLWCLTTLSTIFQLFHRGPFYWYVKEDPPPPPKKYGQQVLIIEEGIIHCRKGHNMYDLVPSCKTKTKKYGC